MKKQKIGMLFIVFMLLLVACAPKTSRAPASVPVKVAPVTPAGQAWEGKWDETLTAAKKEGRITVTTSAGNEVRYALIEGFKKVYGIDLEVVVAPGSTWVPPIQAERRAGLYLRDVVIAGTGPTVQSVKPAGLLDPLESAFILPELTNPEIIKKVWLEGKLHWVDADHTILTALLSPGAPLVINTDLVKEDEIRSWKDLLNPKWKGKIVIPDLSLPGTGASFVVYIDQVLGWDWLQQLVKNEPIVLQDTRLQLDWAARGKVAMALAPDPPTYASFKQIGAPLKALTPKEGTWLTTGHAGVSIINRPAHPDAARVFINWLLSKEGQTVLARSLGGQSTREDVPFDFLDSAQVRQAGMNYFNKEREDILLARVEMTAKAKQIIAPLIK